MAEEVVRELRASFAAGRTWPLEWRAAQLRALVRMIEEKEEDISAAIHADLAKPHMESYLHEVQLVPCSTMLPPAPYTHLVPCCYVADSALLCSVIRLFRSGCRACSLSKLKDRILYAFDPMVFPAIKLAFFGYRG
jgi:hypothetical protein